MTEGYINKLQMMLNILSIYFQIAILVTAYFGFSLISNQKYAQMRFVFYLIIALVFYTFGYLMELNSNSLQTAMFWNQVQYFGIPFICPFWFVASLRHIKKIVKFTSFGYIAVFALPIVSFVARLTNEFHHLFYKDFSFEVIDEMGHLYLSKGPFYYINSMFSILLLLIMSTIFIYSCIKSEGLMRKHNIKLTIISFLPLCAALVTSLDAFGIGLDYTAIFLPISIVLISVLSVKNDIFNINEYARNNVFQESHEGILVVNQDKKIVDYNRKAVYLFAQQGVQLDCVNLDFYKDNKTEFIKALFNDDKIVVENTVEAINRYFEITTTKIKNKLQKDCGYIKTIKDVTDDILYQMKLKCDVEIDELSQLYNRRGFFGRAEESMQHLDNGSMKMFLIMMDIDDFKVVNDTFGHQIGDEVIVAISQLLKNSFRREDIIGRFGGEEFVSIILAKEEKNVFKRMEVFRKKLEESRIVSADKNYQVTVSIGVAEYMQAMELDQLLSFADQALYSAKREGKNQVKIYHSDS